MKALLNKPIILLGLVTAIIYNSWPLGYLLNPGAAHRGLASSLEAVNQPYNWLFVGGDVLCGLLTLVIAWFLIKHRTSRTALFVLSGLVIFGVMTAVSALLPLNCSSDVASCGYGLSQSFSLHDLTGAIASFALFIAMLYTALAFKHQYQITRLNISLLIVWAVMGLWYLAVSFISVQQHPAIHQLLIPSQQIFLIISGALICLMTYCWESFESSELLRQN